MAPKPWTDKRRLCEDCIGKNAKKRRTARGARRDARISAAYYAKNRAAVLARVAARRLAKKLARICRECPMPTAPDSHMCEACGRVKRESQRVPDDLRWQKLETTTPSERRASRSR